MNFIRKHTLELAAKGVERPSARLFSNPKGDFGSMVNERVSQCYSYRLSKAYASYNRTCQWIVVSSVSG